jgi:hypothetical protein
MRDRYNEGTHVECSEPRCRRKIFFDEAEVVVRDGKRMVQVSCIQPGCIAYQQPRWYDEAALEIHGKVRVA